MIYVTSDLHFNHDRPFIYEPRGFSSVEEMNEAIVERWNKVVTPNDTVIVLGDIMLGGPDKLQEGLDLVSRLNGILRLVRGNHDSDKRWMALATMSKAAELQDAMYFKYKKYHLYLTHFPCITANLEKESVTQMTLNLYGHTHQKDNFFEGRPYMYHVGCDSHNCTPVLLDDALKEMKEKFYEVKDEIE